MLASHAIEHQENIEETIPISCPSADHIVPIINISIYFVLCHSNKLQPQLVQCLNNVLLGKAVILA